ncbi:MAG: 50S ribosomal protein L6 [Victivallales bacterium]|jgi:large subunit ribosomal protein L6|nr:50S ribosomal protein L6 [Victivallales bacterium]MBT7163248.1 50S ribosomal protein L6 [Victivallales bacterium]MBT7301208.1 50S ribosomal protein L6 [Victivallales bacterium]
MSRMGKMPIQVADKVKVDISDASVTVTGPKGTLDFTVPAPISVAFDSGIITVSRTGENRDAKAKHGMVRSILQNHVTGVSEGFKRALEIQGVGYRGQLKGSHLTLNLGYSNPVEYDIPEGVAATMPDQTHIVLESIDKQLVGQTAANIRAFRPPDAYKGKGVRYAGEQVSLKEGKTV